MRYIIRECALGEQNETDLCASAGAKRYMRRALRGGGVARGSLCVGKSFCASSSKLFVVLHARGGFSWLYVRISM